MKTISQMMRESFGKNKIIIIFVGQHQQHLTNDSYVLHKLFAGGRSLSTVVDVAVTAPPVSSPIPTKSCNR
jgi:hypothetical protein